MVICSLFNTDNYANLKGGTDPYEYLQRIREDGYATALEYVDNVYSVVESQNLTRFDSDEYNPDAEQDVNTDNTENMRKSAIMHIL